MSRFKINWSAGRIKSLWVSRQVLTYTLHCVSIGPSCVPYYMVLTTDTSICENKYIYRLWYSPPSPPYVRISTSTDGEYVMRINAAHVMRPPAIVTTRHPKQLIRPLVTGPVHLIKHFIQRIMLSATSVPTWNPIEWHHNIIKIHETHQCLIPLKFWISGDTPSYIAVLQTATVQSDLLNSTQKYD